MLRFRREKRVANGPSVGRIKKEKRDLEVEPVSAGMSRRRFLTFLGTGSAALAAGSSGVLVGCAEGEEQGAGKQDAGNQGSSGNEEAQASAATNGSASFAAIDPTDEDE